MKWTDIRLYNRDGWDSTSVASAAADFNDTPELTMSITSQSWWQYGTVLVKTIGPNCYSKNGIAFADVFSSYDGVWQRCTDDAGYPNGKCNKGPGLLWPDHRVMFAYIYQNECGDGWSDWCGTDELDQHVTTHETGHVVGLTHPSCGETKSVMLKLDCLPYMTPSDYVYTLQPHDEDDIADYY